MATIAKEVMCIKEGEIEKSGVPLCPGSRGEKAIMNEWR
jgi:hypothetical protein